MVFYVSYGTPNGEYESAERAAVVTQVHPMIDLDAVHYPNLGLCVLNPTGQFYNPDIPYSDDYGKGGTWHFR